MLLEVGRLAGDEDLVRLPVDERGKVALFAEQVAVRARLVLAMMLRRVPSGFVTMPAKTSFTYM
jgi:hypothetical protein